MTAKDRTKLEGRESTSSTIGVHRRRFIAAAGSGVLGGIAGCVSDEPDGGSEPDDDEPESDDSDDADDAYDADDADGDPELGEAIELLDSYAFEVTTHYQAADVSGRYYQGDLYHEITTTSGERVESYHIGDESYVTVSGLCIHNPDSDADPASDVELGMTRADTYQAHVEGNVTIRPTGTDTIDGDPVYVYELSTQDVDAVYYVHTETGFLRRYEQETAAGGVTVDFHSWGEADPIEPPAECADGQTDEDDDEDTTTGPEFGEAIELLDSYAFEITTHYQAADVSGRYYQGDLYHEITTTSGERVESYHIGDESYVTVSGLCIHNPDSDADPASDVELGMTRADTYEGHVEGHVTIRPTGTDTIDGDPVYVYELSTGDVEAMYYVHTETGFLRRYEQETAAGRVTVDFHSWGEADPIEPPDDCL